MKTYSFFRIVLISILGFVVVLECNAQPDKEKRSEKKKLKQTELKKSYEQVGSLVNSRTFAFHSDITKKKYPSVNDEGILYERTVIRFNDSTIFIGNPNLPLSSDYKIYRWDLEGNPKEHNYYLKVSAFNMDERIAVYLRIFSDNKAQAELYGPKFLEPKFLGDISPN
jgi:hypothetical protein